MAKKAKVKSPSKEVMANPISAPPGEDEYRAKDDAHDIMRYAMLKKDGARHSKAMDLLRAAAALNPEPASKTLRMQPRNKGRGGRRA
jgi:hypothetical protein